MFAVIVVPVIAAGVEPPIATPSIAWPETNKAVRSVTAAPLPAPSA